MSGTWLNSNMFDAQFMSLSYTLYRNDWAGRTGGGVLIYIKSSLPSRLVISSDYVRDNPEFIRLEVWQSSRQKVLVGAVYNSPTSTSLNRLEANLDDIMPHYIHVVLLGDCNINMLSTSLKSDSFLDFCGSLGLNMINYDATHHTSSSHSWIDHCLVNNLDLVVLPRQSSGPFLVDHGLFFLEYDYNIRSQGWKTIWCRN